MKTMTVRQICQSWCDAERALAEGEIIVTRDAVPVAEIVPYTAPAAAEGKRKLFDPVAHTRWLKRISKNE